MMGDDFKLTQMEADALREVGNIGTGNAATSLSQMLNQKIDLIIPETRFIPIQEFAAHIGSPDEIFVCTYLQVIGDVRGESLFLFSKEDALRIIDLMMGQPEGTSMLIDELGESALKEMSNVFEGSYLSSLANFFQIKMLPDVPHITQDMLQAVLDFVLAKVSNYANEILSIKTEIVISDQKVKGVFILLFDDNSLKQLLSIMEKMYG